MDQVLSEKLNGVLAARETRRMRNDAAKFQHGL
jgi:hypothetical protein